MWWRSKLNKEITELSLKLSKLELTVEHLKTLLASLRGIMNKKLYSGKMKEEDPDWLVSNMGFVGITKDKKDEILNV